MKKAFYLANYYRKVARGTVSPQKHHVFERKLFEYDLDPSSPDDRFKILAFAAQSYGRAVGADPVASYFDLAAGRDFDPNFNLAGVPTNFGNTHYEHDAQFMYDIQQRWPYWDKLLEGLNIPYKRWSRP
jgi:hypothetical protein